MRKFLSCVGFSLAFASLSWAHVPSSSKIFLVGTESVNMDMTLVELAWLPKVTDVAPSLTGVLPRDPRIVETLETCGKQQGFDLSLARSDNTFGGFALQIGFDPVQNSDFGTYLTCALNGVASLKPDDDIFLTLQQNFYGDVNYLSYVLSLMTEFGYGLAREEFASPVPRPSELYSLTLEDYRSAWPALFDTSDLYVTAVSSTGVAEVLVAVDELIDKTYGRPSQAPLPKQPPYTRAPLEGLGLKLPEFDRVFYQLNRVFTPSIEGSVVESSLFSSIMNTRLDAYRQTQGLDPQKDVFRDTGENSGGNADIFDVDSGLLGLQSSSFIDGNYIAGLTFLGVFQNPQPMAPTVDVMIAAIKEAMAEPFTQGEFDKAVAELRTDECSLEPLEGIAESHLIWLREDLFHGRANNFIATNVLGCDNLTLDGVNAIRDQTLHNSNNLIYGIGAIIEDAETLARPICLVDDIGELEFECSKSEFQL